MAQGSRIEWTDHTFNPWIGCQRISAGCVHCYAEQMAKRFKNAEWGPTAERKKTSPKYWRDPLNWNRQQWVECCGCGWRGDKEDLWPVQDHYNNAKPGELRCPSCEKSSAFIDTRQRVFCASMADVFEDNAQLANWRAELFALIDATPNLDWLILTKRPGRIFSLGTDAVGEVFDNWLDRHPNVWLGTSVENQAAMDERGPDLLRNCANVLFLSIEPLLEGIEIREYIKSSRINWVIVGGESGPACRPFEAQWARSIRDQCRQKGVAFFMKQLGGHPHKRDQLTDLPEDLRIREWPR